MTDWEAHFRGMKRGQPSRAAVAFGAEYGCGYGAEFGVLERGIQIPGQPTGTVVIRPGRYWLDAFGDKRKVLADWFKGKPEVHVESQQEDLDSKPPRTFAIFTVPKTANNFNLNGVWFPTKELGFPTVADANVQSSDDTVQRPPVPTPSSVVKDWLGTSDSTSGLPFGVSMGTVLKIAAAAGVVILIATLPGQLIRKL